VFGGTFDPVHVGHLRVGEEVREEFGLERVVFVPSYEPPHKEGGVRASAFERLAMVRLAVEGSSCFEASDVEVARRGRSFTVDTLESLGRREGKEARLFFIVGLDAFVEIGTWRDCGRLFGLADFVVVERRLSCCAKEGRRELAEFLMSGRVGRFEEVGGGAWFEKCEGGGRVWYFRCTCLGISSTQVRSLVRRGMSVRYLIPETVRLFIEEKGIYG